ncbi:M14 family zinc carboxypeptidase [Diplocloster hominis]|uniref:M14 family zinc carboxypeptidase n=1 Tax=Diplocloster hominis TaxID=3079010 RepID=UPI0031B9AFCF
MVQLNKTYTYEEMMERLNDLAGDYRSLIQIQVIGHSHDERKIPMIRLGNGEKTLICTAGVHGRETINPVLMIKMIEEYCEAYEKRIKIGEYDVFDLLNGYEISFIPLLNPDGYEIALHGFDQIRNPILRQAAKMMNIPHEDWKYNARGVDINRNFPSRSYVQQRPNEMPLSEAESRLLVTVFQTAPSIGYLDFHSRGKIIYYYRGAMSGLYNQRQRRIAKRLSNISKYSMGKKEEEMLTNNSGGNTVHYYSEYIGKPAITVETVEEEAGFPLDIRYQEEAWEEIHTIPLEILRIEKSESRRKMLY